MNLYDIEVKTRKGEMESLKNYEGKVILVINSATGCGFTKQYDELEALYAKYNEKGFVILDFPCNQFNEQAPGTDEEIHEFCTVKFGVKFPIFSKIDVNGENESPLFTYLKSKKPYVKPKGLKNKTTMNIVEGLSKTKKDPSAIRWNFTKFLIDRQGNIIERYEPVIQINEIEKKIEELL
ncbi:MAG: glutathione peroxidase [Acholeplasmatales bacterium]|nr:glutathione peroxidase [Acholeplasmatales bacterium]